jgi:hypothetical protein
VGLWRSMTIVTVAALTLPVAAPAHAGLLGGTTALLTEAVETTVDTTLDVTDELIDTTDPLLDATTSLIGTLNDPLWSTLTSLQQVTDGVVADLAPAIDPVLLEVATATGTDLASLTDPLGYGWTSHLPAWPDEDHLRSAATDCPPGKVQCVDQVIREMTRRYDRLGCDHAAAFAMTYLLTTEEYRRAVEDPHFFRDNAFVNHQDAVFAAVYFDAIDDWRRDRLDLVPPAWRIALDAGDRQTANGLGDVLLGMNAHIRRDLPFVLAAIGMVTPEGESRKLDHDRVNVFLERVQGEIRTELARRHDPTVSAAGVPGTELDEVGTFHLIQLWREEAWRKAELLVAAPTLDARERVARFIEADAATSALGIRTLFATADPAPRAAHCGAWLASR